MFKRNIHDRLRTALAQSPVVLLRGARQTGKSTLVKLLAKEKGYSYFSFDDVRMYTAAKNDPINFIAGLPKPVILDEVQRVPEIFLTIKQDVDEHREFGRYLLTGSADPLLMPQLGDSLAGRMQMLTLYPFSQGELLSKQDDFVDRIFTDRISTSYESTLSKAELAKKIFVGGYPTVQISSEASRYDWFSSYITLILGKDIKDLSHISDVTSFPDLLHILAARAGNIVNVADISRKSGIAITTLHRYIGLLVTLFVIDMQKAWSANIANRFIHSPKVYLVDSGLLSFFLDATPEKIVHNPYLMGGILENFVVGEIQKQLTWNKTRASMYHMRTKSGIEVDIVLEDAAGNIVGIEIKNSQDVWPEDFKGLRYLQENFKQKFLRGIVLYAGEKVIPSGQNLQAVPISALWA